MYIHLGNNVMLPTSDIIGIFDLENTSISKRTRDFLNKAEKEISILLENENGEIEEKDFITEE